jgi:ribosome-associated heat shock protein Hsp15
VRTRSAAAALTIVGHVRVNGVRVAAPSRDVKCGDVVTVALDGGVRVLKVTGLTARRGNAAAALRLYEDLDKPRDDASGPAPADCQLERLAGAKSRGAPKSH